MGARTIVTLLTDFGTRDGYVAAMKGVILGLAPESRVVDAAHEIPPQDVRAAAWVLRQYALLYPEGTLHVAVVDPGVGSARRALAVEAGGQRFLAPDNGMLWWIFRANPCSRVRALRPDVHRPGAPSATFHGRDVFAHAAGLLAAGAAMVELTEPCDAPLAPGWGEPREVADGWVGEVIHVDRFGNLITNITVSSLASCPTSRLSFEIAGREIRGLSRTYSDVSVSQPVCYIGSDGHLEVAINQRNAAGTWGLSAGEAVTVRKL